MRRKVKDEWEERERGGKGACLLKCNGEDLERRK